MRVCARCMYCVCACVCGSGYDRKWVWQEMGSLHDVSPPLEDLAADINELGVEVVGRVFPVAVELVPGHSEDGRTLTPTNTSPPPPEHIPPPPNTNPHVPPE